MRRLIVSLSSTPTLPCHATHIRPARCTETHPLTYLILILILCSRSILERMPRNVGGNCQGLQASMISQQALPCPCLSNMGGRRSHLQTRSNSATADPAVWLKWVPQVGEWHAGGLSPA
jgi:hypothetical protein